MQLSGRAGVIISSLTANLYLVLSTVAVVLAAITWLIVNSYVDQQPILVTLAGIVLFLSLIYTTYELLITVQTAREDLDRTAEVGISIFAGSFLLGIVAVVLAFATQQDASLDIPACAISIVSLIILWLLTMNNALSVTNSGQKNSQPVDPSPTPFYRNPQPVSPPSLPSFSSPGVIVPPPIRYEPPRPRPVSLPPLFAGDPLYQMPDLSTLKHSRLFYVVKEREDGCSISAKETSFALSDGASASSLPRPWATLLTQKWISRPLGKADLINFANFENWLEEPRSRWNQWVKETWFAAVNERNRLTGDYPVQPEEVNRILDRSAFATLLGVSISRQSLQWQALAIGDTCLFHVRPTAQEPLLLSLPMKSSTEFSLRPPLLSTHGDADLDGLRPFIQFEERPYQKGDLLFLATDALAQWLLSRHEQGYPCWRELSSIPDQAAFTRFVEEQRYAEKMEEDDTTLVIIEL